MSWGAQDREQFVDTLKGFWPSIFGKDPAREPQQILVWSRRLEGYRVQTVTAAAGELYAAATSRIPPTLSAFLRHMTQSAQTGDGGERSPFERFLDFIQPYVGQPLRLPDWDASNLPRGWESWSERDRSMLREVRFGVIMPMGLLHFEPQEGGLVNVLLPFAGQGGPWCERFAIKVRAQLDEPQQDEEITYEEYKRRIKSGEAQRPDVCDESIHWMEEQLGWV